MSAEHEGATGAELPPAEWLVDGFNVLHAGILRGRDRRDWWNEERRRLVIERAARLVARGERVCVVFDGTEPAPEAPAAGPRIVFAPDADEWILRAVRAAPDPSAIAVVTADRSVADRARRRGARVVPPREFLARCAGEPPAASGDLVR